MPDLPYPGAEGVPHTTSGFVPWPVYLDDRREARMRLERIETKLDVVLQRDAREDGVQVAEHAAEQAVATARRSRGELARDIGLCLLSAALAVAGAIVTAALI